MSLNQPAKTRQHSAQLAALPRSSVSPSRHSEDEEFVQLNKGQFRSQENADESGPSAFMNPTFDHSTFIDSFNTLALQQKPNQRKNHQLYQILAQLTENIDDLSTRTNVNGPSAFVNNPTFDLSTSLILLTLLPCSRNCSSKRTISFTNCWRSLRKRSTT